MSYVFNKTDAIRNLRTVSVWKNGEVSMNGFYNSHQ